MLVRVNKKISVTKKDVDFSAISLGTVSDVWLDEESDSKKKTKRRNRIQLTREADDPTELLSREFDA